MKFSFNSITRFQWIQRTKNYSVVISILTKKNIIYLFALQPKINASNVVEKVLITFNIVLRNFVK